MTAHQLAVRVRDLVDAGEANTKVLCAAKGLPYRPARWRVNTREHEGELQLAMKMIGCNGQTARRLVPIDRDIPLDVLRDIVVGTMVGMAMEVVGGHRKLGHRQ